MAADNEVQVKFGAQTQEIEAGAKKAADSVKGATDQMKGSFTELKNSVNAFHSDFTSTLSSLTGTLSKLGGAIVAIGALMAGGALFKGVVDEYVKMNSEAKKLGTIMGTNVTDAQALLESFKRVGVEGDTVTRALMIMVRQLKSNEEGFVRNGVAVRDSGGKMLSMNEIMFNSIDRLKEMEAGTERNKMATMLFGRSVQDMPGFLKMSEAAVDAMKMRLADLGLTLDDVSASKARAFKEGMHDVNLVFTAMKYRISSELMPLLIRMGAWFSGEGKDVVKVFTSIVTGAANAVGFMASNLARLLAIYNSLGNATGARGGGGGGGWTEPGDPKPPEPKPTGEFVDKPGKGGGKGEGMAAQWQAELDQMKMSSKVFQSQDLELEKVFRAKLVALGREATKEEEENLKAAQKQAAMNALKAEQDFWKSKLEAAGAGEKEMEGVSHKIATLELQINKARLQSENDLLKAKSEANKTSLKEREALLAHEGKLEQIDLQIKQANLNHMAKMGTISKKEEAKAYEELLKEKHAADLRREKQVLEGYKNDLKKFKEHELAMEVTAKGRVLETQKAEQATAEASAGLWGDIASGIGNAFTSALSAMTSAGATFGSVMAGIGQSILSLFISVIGKIVQEWLMGFVATLVGAKTTDALKILSLAGVAAAGGFASVMATVPFPLNVAMAPVVAAAAFSETASFAAAAGGWDVPADSMALLHKNEMVLPASLADNVRNMTGGAGANIKIHFAPNINHRMTQSEWHSESAKMIKAINRQLNRFGKAPLGPSYA